MFTSNFEIAGTRPEAVAISATVPPWYQGRRYVELAPTLELISLFQFNYITIPDFIEEYHQLLENRNLNPEVVLRELGMNAILLCWCKPKAFCHRKLVANWLKENLNIQVQELPFK